MAPPRKQLAQAASRKTAPVPVIVDNRWYNIMRIYDRRLTARGYEYRRLPVTWRRPGNRAPILDSEGLADYCNEVDEWKAQGLDDDYEAYIARVQPALLTADVSGVCLLGALKLGLQLAGDPCPMFDTLASEFAYELESKSIAISDGLNWTMLKPFVRRLMANGSTVLFKVLKKNLHASGHRQSGASVRKKLVLR
ncbi:TPA: hypothetical protein N0F65_010681 [Lagenidium giganteum]|uniref:Uncharacterized protein n=1 Tax=Lagenidium giganteum TaxID=4803 RepID=A0AAV2Z701_9STRA|nr:TPA: hypothetical protein N0F65_010681 [Lagenidium giganteum]